MMKWMRCAALCLCLCLLCTCALADTTPTPPPLDIDEHVQQPPEEIRRVLDIAWQEWETLAGKTLKDCNKYTEWRGKGISFG